MGDFCLVPLDDKISVLENSIGVLEEIHDALQVKRDTVNCLICDLADLDGKTHRLMMQIQLMVLSLKKERHQTPSYLAETAGCAPFPLNWKRDSQDVSNEALLERLNYWSQKDQDFVKYHG
ncbi:histone 3 [Purpureocillium lavendulum]|uniref:Histone 3 n=1 Tax=Purpureocillium lavendulum TaxID=1247861 RepID=A0AB34FNZ7_9HYPO|nr:histone 3 [Purpureocillium lavendulum]